MKFDALEAFGIRREMIEAWKRDLGDELLPVQARAVQPVFGGRNLVVFAPTSSGKTMIGEMAAAKAAGERRRALYLVPLKAIAEEKYREFCGRYEPLGLTVGITTRDHSEQDGAIKQGNEHITIATYEKLASLLVARPKLIESIGLVVVDELHTLGDAGRGGELEILLAKIRSAATPPQILGLSAVLGNPGPLAAWLGADQLVEKHRPVALRKGVLCRGSFDYIEHNTGARGRERFPEDEATSKRGMILAAAAHLGRREQVLVFVATRADAQLFAQRLSHMVEWPIAQEAIDELAELDDTQAKELLAASLENGVAFHHADLTLDARELIERHFAEGKIRVVFSTPTLAMGVNLPVRNVLIDLFKWEKDRRYGWSEGERTRMEFENMSGRAGRLGLEREFGRAIICEPSPIDAEALMKSHVLAEFEELRPALAADRLDEHLVNLFASGMVATRAEAPQFLLSTFTGHQVWSKEGDAFRGRVGEAIDRLIAGGLVEEDGVRIRPTELGKIVATKGVRVETVLFLARWCREYAGRQLEPIDVLLALAMTEDAAEQVYINLSTDERRSRRYFDLIGERAHLKFDGESMEAVKKTLVTARWIEEDAIRDIERLYNVGGGSVQRCGEGLAWLAETLAAVAGRCGWTDDEIARVDELASRLALGVKPELLPLAAARVPGVGRRHLRGLFSAGIESVDALREASKKDLAAATGRRIGPRLYAQFHKTAAPKRAKPERAPAIEFNLEDEIRITAIPGKRGRTSVEINGRPVSLLFSEFKALVHLVLTKLTNAAAFTEKGQFASPGSASVTVSRLLKRLRLFMKDPAARLISNNQLGGYRLDLDAVRVMVDWDALERHPVHEVRGLILKPTA